MIRRCLALALALALCAATACVAEVESEPLGEGTGGGKADSPTEPTDWEAIAARCPPPEASEPVLYANDFRWWYTRAEMAPRFDEIYGSGKRLHQRAYHDAEANQLVLPHVEAWGGRVTLSRRLVVSVRRHIETALERRYAEHVFFPDMGHSHFFIPESRWQEAYAGTPVAGMSDMYTQLLDDPELRVLYHTAEQLQTHDDQEEILPDPELQWRYYTRNPIGGNTGDGRLDIHRDLSSRGNTVRHYEGHKFFSAGFSVSASADGCFPYSFGGQTYYFDLSLFDLPYNEG